MNNIKQVTDATFITEVLQSSKPTLVDYWADWCSPCKQLSPIIDELAEEHSGKINFVKIDTDANPSTAAQQGIMSLPTVQVFVQGEVVKSFSGGKTKSALLKMLEEYL